MTSSRLLNLSNTNAANSTGSVLNVSNAETGAAFAIKAVASGATGQTYCGILAAKQAIRQRRCWRGSTGGKGGSAQQQRDEAERDDTRRARGYPRGAGRGSSQKVAGIGIALRHDYESIAAPVMWKLAQADLPALEKACREELKAEEERERRD
jgi:hypothetical protein